MDINTKINLRSFFSAVESKSPSSVYGKLAEKVAANGGSNTPAAKIPETHKRYESQYGNRVFRGCRKRSHTK